MKDYEKLKSKIEDRAAEKLHVRLIGEHALALIERDGDVSAAALARSLEEAIQAASPHQEGRRKIAELALKALNQAHGRESRHDE